ncbi:MAG: hypothetical protein QOE00_2125 [Ilumatobacteraceae bacterium]|jgi:hypothetical protein
MRTRTLLLLAIGCGLAILLAGGIQLLRVGGQQQSSTLLTTGEPGKAGDVAVTLLSSTATDSTLDAVVRISGIDDPEGLKGFTLVGPGKVLPVTSSTCAGITVAPVDCSLTFATGVMAGTSRQLIFHRADQQLRWVLAQGD